MLAGQTLLVLGAAGGVGLAAVQLGKVSEQLVPLAYSRQPPAGTQVPSLCEHCFMKGMDSSFHAPTLFICLTLHERGGCETACGVLVSQCQGASIG